MYNQLSLYLIGLKKTGWAYFVTFGALVNKGESIVVKGEIEKFLLFNSVFKKCMLHAEASESVINHKLYLCEDYKLVSFMYLVTVGHILLLTIYIYMYI